MGDDRLALLPLTGAGETHCEGCQMLAESDDGDTWCAAFRKEKGGWETPEEDPDSDDGFMRLPQCLASERAAKRLLKVEEAASEYVCLFECEQDVSDIDARLDGALRTLRAALTTNNITKGK